MISRLYPRILTALQARSITTTSRLNVKEIRETRKGKVVIVEGVRVESPRSETVAVPPSEAKEEACPLCRLGLKHLKYTDVLILNQFLEPGGKLMSIRDSKLCGKQYWLVNKLVKMAQMCRLLPRPNDFEVYGPWDKLNSYHDWPPRRRDQIMKQIQPYYWKNVDFRKGDIYSKR